MHLDVHVCMSVHTITLKTIADICFLLGSYLHCESERNWTVFHLSITFQIVCNFNNSFTVADRNYLSTNT